MPRKRFSCEDQHYTGEIVGWKYEERGSIAKGVGKPEGRVGQTVGNHKKR